MWVVRAGKKSIYYSEFIKNSRIFLSWEEMNPDLSQYRTIEEFKGIAQREKKLCNSTAITTLGCQLKYFCCDMHIGDYVLIPSENSRMYTLAQISGEYEYDAKRDGLKHSRKINIIIDKMPRDIFPNFIVASLGAYRTIFHANHEDEIMKIIATKYKVQI